MGEDLMSMVGVGAAGALAAADGPLPFLDIAAVIYLASQVDWNAVGGFFSDVAQREAGMNQPTNAVYTQSFVEPINDIIPVNPFDALSYGRDDSMSHNSVMTQIHSEPMIRAQSIASPIPDTQTITEPTLMVSDVAMFQSSTSVTVDQDADPQMPTPHDDTKGLIATGLLDLFFSIKLMRVGNEDDDQYYPEAMEL